MELLFPWRVNLKMVSSTAVPILAKRKGGSKRMACLVGDDSSVTTRMLRVEPVLSVYAQRAAVGAMGADEARCQGRWEGEKGVAPHLGASWEHL